jgi:hypothetical protein
MSRPYIRKSLRSENTKGSLQSEIPGSNSETRGRFCEGLGGNIVVQYPVGPIISLCGRIIERELVDRFGNQMYPMVQMLFPNNDVIFKDDNAPILTAETGRFLQGLQSIKVNFNIFPGQHNY